MEILFKAKRADNEEWVEAKSLIQGIIEGGEFTQIEHSDFDNFRQYEVIPETVCQFTGLTDKNGNKIFDKDRLKVNALGMILGSSLGVNESDIEFKCIISIEKLGIWLQSEKEENSGYIASSYLDFDEDENQIGAFEIIGNIHDDGK